MYGLTLINCTCPLETGSAFMVRVVNMLSETEQERLANTQANFDMDVEASMERVLASLTTGELSERIANAARLAVAKHMVMTAQAMRSTVEAEDSAK